MIPASFKAKPEDFVVEELPLYEPSGEGEHLYLRFEKIDLTTDEAVRRIARALGVHPRDVGVPGMKDRRAVTTQTVSVPCHAKDTALEARARALSLDGIRLEWALRHRNKLKTGHLAGNRFVVTLRDVPRARVAEATAALGSIAERGAPNAYGGQRFGRDGDNAARALAWLKGEAPEPRDPKQRRFLASALQSAVFNRVLERRVADGSWHVPEDGDVLELHASGGLFACTDVQVDRERAARGEVSPTGPMHGPKMKPAGGRIAALEEEALREVVGTTVDFGKLGTYAEGTRRALRVWVREMRWETLADVTKDAMDVTSLRVYFVLPRGAYATTVLGGVFDLREPALAGPQGGAGGDG
ncbi:MAG: tRNA pseudouridine(13) synthase TruD [Myxococcales bacterium]|nr:tRNA pseudouridine(13) synthase TruD [Myxococcales bacterium]